MTVPVLSPVVFSVAWLIEARSVLAFRGAIPRSRRFQEGFLMGDVFPLWGAEIRPLCSLTRNQAPRSDTQIMKGGGICNMTCKSENLNKTEEYLSNANFEVIDGQLTVSTTRNIGKNNLNNEATLKTSDEQMMTIIKILYYTYKLINNN
jgi:hypothetical protein